MAARLSNRAARIRLGELGAWPGHIPLLLGLIEEDGLLQKDLVQRSKMEQPTVAEHLKRLEKKGFIIRRPDANDGRASRIYLTAKSKALSGKLIAELERGSQIFTAGIPHRDLVIFDRVICQIMDRLEEFIQTSYTKPARKRGS
jgi:DNA-binding MarR family transcriptional regulator